MIHQRDVNENIDDRGGESQFGIILVTMKVMSHPLAITGLRNMLAVRLHETDILQQDVQWNKIIMDIRKDMHPIVLEVVEESRILPLTMMNMTGAILILGTKGLGRHRRCHLQDMNTEVGTTSITVLKIHTTVAEMIRRMFVQTPELLLLSSERHVLSELLLPSTCLEHPIRR